MQLGQNTSLWQIKVFLFHALFKQPLRNLERSPRTFFFVNVVQGTSRELEEVGD